MITARYWLLPQGDLGRDSLVLTSQEMRRAGLHPLRCLDLGRISVDAAGAKARSLIAGGLEPVDIMARNIRLAMESGRLARWHIGREQADRLRAGEAVEFSDAAGSFAVAWSPLESDDESQD